MPRGVRVQVPSPAQRFPKWEGHYSANMGAVGYIWSMGRSGAVCDTRCTAARFRARLGCRVANLQVCVGEKLSGCDAESFRESHERGHVRVGSPGVVGTA